LPVRHPLPMLMHRLWRTPGVVRPQRRQRGGVGEWDSSSLRAARCGIRSLGRFSRGCRLPGLARRGDEVSSGGRWRNPVKMPRLGRRPRSRALATVSGPDSGKVVVRSPEGFGAPDRRGVASVCARAWAVWQVCKACDFSPGGEEGAWCNPVEVCMRDDEQGRFSSSSCSRRFACGRDAGCGVGPVPRLSPRRRLPQS